MSKGVLTAQTAQVLQLVIWICNSEMIREAWKVWDLGCAAWATQIRQSTGEVLKNAQAFDFTFILQNVNQYLFTPVHLYHMAFCYKATRAWTCLFWTENSLIQRDFFPAERLKHCITLCHRVMEPNPVFYCTTWESAARNDHYSTVKHANWVEIQCYFHILNCFVKPNGIKMRFAVQERIFKDTG